MKTIKEKALIFKPKAADVARRIPEGIHRAAELGHLQSDRSEQDQEGGKPEDQVSDSAQQGALHAADFLGSKFKRGQRIAKHPFLTKQVRSDRVSYTKKSSAPSIQPIQNAVHSRTISTQMKSAHLLQTQKKAAKSITRVTQFVSQKIVVPIKSILTGLRSFGTVIATGGGTAVAIIILLALIGWILTTPAGILAGGRYEDDPNHSVYTVLDDLANEVDDRINEIIRDHGDGCEISIQYINGKENVLDQVGPLVLAVYAVKVSTDPTEPDQIATLNARKEVILRDIFWQAVQIKYEVQEETSTRLLIIRVEYQPMEEMVIAQNLNAAQRKVLLELMDKTSDSVPKETVINAK